MICLGLTVKRMNQGRGAPPGAHAQLGGIRRAGRFIARPAQVGGFCSRSNQNGAPNRVISAVTPQPSAISKKSLQAIIPVRAIRAQENGGFSQPIGRLVTLNWSIATCALAN